MASTGYDITINGKPQEGEDLIGLWIDELIEENKSAEKEERIVRLKNAIESVKGALRQLNQPTDRVEKAFAAIDWDTINRKVENDST